MLFKVSETLAVTDNRRRRLLEMTMGARFPLSVLLPLPALLPHPAFPTATSLLTPVTSSPVLSLPVTSLSHSLVPTPTR